MKHPLVGSDDDIDMSWIKDVLKKNSSKNFVDRILNRDRYPDLDLGGGVTATHIMEWADNPETGEYYVYPTVIWNGKELIQHNSDDAWEYAKKNKEYITFDNPMDASWFSANYKRVWDE